MNRISDSQTHKATSKGLILNIVDFKGPIEFLNNTVRHNDVFIPSAIVSNSQKFNTSVVNILFNFCVNEADESLVFEKNETVLTKHFVHFLNYFDPRIHSTLLNTYQTMSPIYIRNANGSHIVFENNTFD